MEIKCLKSNHKYFVAFGLAGVLTYEGGIWRDETRGYVGPDHEGPCKPS